MPRRRARRRAARSRGPGQWLAVQPVELEREAIEHVAGRRLELGPRGELADVARRHRERVGHQLGQVARALAVQDPGQGGGEEPVGRLVEAQRAAHEQQLGERPLVERERDLVRDALVVIARPAAGAGRRDPRRRMGGAHEHALGEGQPARGVRVPRQPERGEPRARLGRRRGIHLGRGQQVGERVEVVADADPALGARLERGRAATGERVEDDVTGSRVAGDERVGECRRKAREVRAHRVEAVAPQPLLGLPLGRDRQLREPERQLEGELTGRLVSRGPRGWWSYGRRNRRRTGHDALGTSCPNAGPGRRRGARSVARWKCRPRAVRNVELQPLGASPGRGARVG